MIWNWNFHDRPFLENLALQRSPKALTLNYSFPISFRFSTSLRGPNSIYGIETDADFSFNLERKVSKHKNCFSVQELYKTIVTFLSTYSVFVYLCSFRRLQLQ